jgi:hypothetical protein
MTKPTKTETQPKNIGGDLVANRTIKNNSKPKKPTADADETQLPTVPGDGVGVAPALCAGAQTSPEHDPIGKYQIAISTGWQKAAQTILGVCKLCAEAHGILDADIDLGHKSRRGDFSCRNCVWDFRSLTAAESNTLGTVTSRIDTNVGLLNRSREPLVTELSLFTKQDMLAVGFWRPRPLNYRPRT